MSSSPKQQYTPPALNQRIPTTSATATRTDHALSIKVMRLRKPTISLPTPIYTEPDDPFHATLVRDTKDAHAELLLPLSVGPIYHGETFRCCISLHNISNTVVKNVGIKVELCTQKKMTLLDNEKHPIALLPASGHRDFTVEHTLLEDGNHTLMCSVVYADESQQESRQLRKIFKFDVKKCVSIRHPRIWLVNDQVFIIIELQNQAPHALAVNLKLKPSDPFYLADTGECPKAVFERAMASGEWRRYLFHLAPKPSDNGPTNTARNVSYGRIEIVWRTNMGERGRLDSSDITQQNAQQIRSKREVEVLSIDLPNEVRLHQPFDASLVLVNNTTDPLDLDMCLNVDRMCPLTCSGPTVTALECIAPKGCISVTLRLVPLATGVQSVTGIELRDQKTDRGYPVPPRTIFVLP